MYLVHCVIGDVEHLKLNFQIASRVRDTNDRMFTCSAACSGPTRLHFSTSAGSDYQLTTSTSMTTGANFSREKKDRSSTNNKQ